MIKKFSKKTSCLALTVAIVFGIIAGIWLSSSNMFLRPVRPITDVGTNYMAFTEHGQDVLKNVEGEDSLASTPDGILSVGRPIPNIELTTYDGQKINLKDFKGQPFVLEVVAYWCDFCQKEVSEYLPPITTDNSDVTFVQAFVEGSQKDTVTNEKGETETVDTIKQFYDSAGQTMDEKIICQENDELFDYLTNELHLTQFPSFIFFDESGRISWFHEGVLEPDVFKNIRHYAFGTGEDGSDERLYNNVANNLYEASNYLRTYENVKADFPEEQRKAVNSMPIDKVYGEAAFYSNVGRKIAVDSKMVDINDKVIDLSDKKGITIYTFLSETDENLEDEVEIYNKYLRAMEGSDNCFIAVLITEASEDAKTMYKNMKVKPDGYVLDAKKDIPKALYNIVLFGSPQAVYVNEEDDICMGSYLGKFTLEALQDSANIINGRHPLYLIPAAHK